MSDKLNPFLNAKKQIKQACELYENCKNDVNGYELISIPKRILEVNIPVKMDD
jgi:glutamate dehydrogenase/leucine dehydrogenase